jgi:hypothetical protein
VNDPEQHGTRDQEAAGRRLSVLLLCDDDRGHAATILEHISALERLSRHRVRRYNPRGISHSRALDLDEFDAVVVHYSLFALSDAYLARDFLEKLGRFQGLKIQFIQDEYRQVDDMAALMRHVGIDVLFTLVPEREIPRVWSEDRLPGVRKIHTLAGYISADAIAHPAPPLEERPLHVGYRGRTLPYWIGVLGQEKAWIAQGFLERAAPYGLRCDIGWTESDRIYGRSWLEFISSCRVTLGSESGATITDFDGFIERRVKDYLVQNPAADFWDVHRNLLAPYEGNVCINVISPRIFEAIALRTGLVLFPGEYSGVIERERHYIVLEKDFSNMGEVVAKIRDVDYLRELTTRAFDEIVTPGRYSLQTFVQQFDAVLDERAGRRAARPQLRYFLARAERPVVALMGRPRQTVGPVRRAFLAYAALRLVGNDEDLRRLLRGRLRLRRRGPSVRRLAADLLRLAVLRRAQNGTLPAGEDFVVSAQFNDVNGSLAFLSVRPEDYEPGVQPDALAAALQSDSVRSIIWNHTLIGESSVFPLTRATWLEIPIGFHGQEGTRELAALREYAAEEPAAVARVLASLARVPTGSRRIPPTHPERHPLPIHLVRHAGNYVPKARLTMKVFRDAAPLRKILVSTLRDRELRGQVKLLDVVGDLVKLHLLREARAGRMADEPAAALVAADNGTVRFRTPVGTEPQTAGSTSGRISKIVWDHSEAGPDLYVPTGRHGRTMRVALGDGVYEFDSLEPLLKAMPGLAHEALFGGDRLE